MSLPVRATVTARVEAVTPEGDEGVLVEFLRAYRDAVQLVVNEIWNLDRTPSNKTLHKIFYSRLREMGFRAHHVSEIYKRAREVVKATKKNSGSKPVLKKLTARIHPLDYKVDYNTKTLKIAVLQDRWIELRLKWYKRLDRYLDGSWRLGEVLVSYRGGKILVYLTFNREVSLREPKTVMGVDINFNNITCTVLDLDGNLVSMGMIPYRGLRRALHLKKLAEGLQRRYPKSWRFLKWARRARSKWLRRARNILVDTAHYVAKRIVEVAREHSALIVFEDLKKLRRNGNGDKKLSWKTQLWCYRRIHSYTEYKALLEGLRVVYVDPRGTSKTPPNGKLLRFINYRFVELGNTITSRDVIASWNLALRALKRMRGSRVTWSPDSPAGEGVRNRPNAGNPEARTTYSQIFTATRK
jgi:putative transposase